MSLTKPWRLSINSIEAASPAKQAVVHGGDEHELGGEGDAADGAADGDLAVLQGLAHDFEGGAPELGELVEEEGAVVGEADFAGAGLPS
jgi:hypothetical protein